MQQSSLSNSRTFSSPQKKPILFGMDFLLWFWFAFPRQLMMLSNFLWVYGPLVYLLWRYGFLNPLPIFNLGYLCFYCCILRILCVFWIQVPIRYIVYKYSLSCCGLAFQSLDGDLWSTKVVNFDEVQFILLSLGFWCHFAIKVTKIYSHFFLLRVF